MPFVDYDNRHGGTGTKSATRDVTISKSGNLSIPAHILAHLGTPTRVVMLVDPDQPEVFAFRGAAHDGSRGYAAQPPKPGQGLAYNVSAPSFLRLLGLLGQYRRCTSEVQPGLVVVRPHNPPTLTEDQRVVLVGLFTTGEPAEPPTD